jgi:hypothetical protein
MQENNKTYWASPLKYAIILLIGVLLGIFLKGNLSLKGLQADNSIPVQEIIDLVKSKYVDKITDAKLNQTLRTLLRRSKKNEITISGIKKIKAPRNASSRHRNPKTATKPENQTKPVKFPFTASNKDPKPNTEH